MFRLFFPLVLCLAVIPRASGGDRKLKAPEVQVIEMSARREDDLITIEGRVKNSGAHPLHALIVIFRIEDGHGTTLSTQRLPVDEPILDPGDESELHAQMKDSPYAARFMVLSETGDGKELHVGNAGPFSVAR